MQHFKCRNGSYSKTDNKVQRFPVPDGQVSWDTSFPDYKPTIFTADYILRGPAWADKVGYLKVVETRDVVKLSGYFAGNQARHFVSLEQPGQE